ncbi:MAG: methyl-accepting chemotaxis protein, partial [Deltaproteobacteria bacterium]|nr:methyl-accepting chemotaxis protein [Deltaproteobacteria bacterium]
AEKSVIDAAGEMDRLVNLSMAALARAGAHSQNISSQAGEIVMAIQFHDITRQQVEHIITALHEVAQLCRGNTSEPDREVSGPEHLGRGQAILKVQAAQLRQVIVEINAVYQRMAGAFDGISREVGELVSNTSGVSREHPGDKTLEQSFGALKKGLGFLQQLLGRGRELIDRMRETARHASDASSLLSRHVSEVRNINTDLHIKALNAIIKSIHLSDQGRTLEVLAQQVTTLSEQSGGFVSEVVEAIESVTDLAGRLGGEPGAGTGRDALEGRMTRAALEAGLNDISIAFQQITDATAEAGQGAETLRADISHKISSLSFLSEFATLLSGHCDRLETMTEMLNPWALDQGDQTVREIDQHLQRYTMESERQIHLQVTGGVAEVAAAATAAPLIEDFGADQNTTEVELFEPSPPASPEDEKPKDDEDFGDNVELF